MMTSDLNLKWLAVQHLDSGFSKKADVGVVFQGYDPVEAAQPGFHPRFSVKTPESLSLSLDELFAVAQGQPLDPAHAVISQDAAVYSLRILRDNTQDYGPGGSHEHLGKKFGEPALTVADYDEMLQKLEQ